MIDPNHTPVKICDFSVAFQQMCSIMAIGQTKSQDETLCELILQTLVLIPEEKISTEGEFANVLNSLFGLQISDHEIRYAIDRLISEGSLKYSDSGVFVLDNKITISLQQSVDNSIRLENTVRDKWQQEILEKHPNLDFFTTWAALRSYLAGAFLRHGIQAVALLDPSLELDGVYSKSLSEILDDAVRVFTKDLKLDAKNAISDFLTNSGSSPERALFIAQLADGAFSYYNLASNPTTSDDFRKHLNSLQLFLDTNFLFGILGLTVNQQVAVSNDLIRVIQSYKFPFKLMRHVKTEGELIKSIARYENDLSKRKWSRNISRAATTSRFIGGVEKKYHQAYVESGIDVESFFRPYRHVDLLLDEKQVEPDESPIDEKAQQQISTLISDYEQFLNRRGREKTSKPIEHDMTLLYLVRQLRSDSKSTLEAGALILTCDYSLFAFDWETSKQHDSRPCTVLPNLFWQVLRPFISSDENFAQSFAQTFAIPEFRTIGSGAAAACSKMLSILAGYKDFPEETAKRMLSNDMLIDQLRKAENDEVFQEFVEAAIVNENAQLIDENALLSRKIEAEQKAKDDAIRQLNETTQTAIENEELFRLEQLERQKAEKAVNTAITEKDTAEKSASSELENRQKLEKKLHIITVILSFLVGFIVIGLFEWFTYKYPWEWLVKHPNSYGLQASIDVLLLSIFVLIFVPKWRKGGVVTLAISILGVILTLLGGPK